MESIHPILLQQAFTIKAPPLQEFVLEFGRLVKNGELSMVCYAMSDKTILIVALGVGAFLLTRGRLAGAQPVGNGATAAQKQFANQNRGPAVVPSIYAQAGGLLAGLLGKYGGGDGASLTSGEYSGLVNNPYVKADAQAVFGNGNVFDSAAAAITKNPFGLYSSDGAAANPAPGFSSVYDYSNEYWY